MLKYTDFMCKEWGYGVMNTWIFLDSVFLIIFYTKKIMCNMEANEKRTVKIVIGE